MKKIVTHQKKGFILLFTVILSMGIFLPTVSAQKVKVVEESQRKKPDWVNGLVKDYIIVVASSPTLDDAQQKALAKVKERIVSSVAENIQTSSEYFRKEQVNNNNSDFQESFETATKTRAADIPFIKGISLSKVDAFYWEKVQEGRNGPTKYYYHVKYPFNAVQLKKLINEFEKMDKALTDQLEGLLAQVETVNNLEEMSQLQKELEALAEGFIDVDPRKDKANAGIARLKDMMKNIGIETINATLGEIRVAVVVGEKTVTTSRKPSVRSNCAKITEVKSQSPEWIIKYSYDECYDDPDNAITIEFKSAYGRTKQDFYFNINADQVDIFVNNDINLTHGDDNGSEVTGAKGHISITSKYESPFIIEKVILNFGKEAPVIVDNINQKFEGKGKHDLNFTINQALAKDTYNAQKYDMIKGTIQYKSVKTGEKSIYKMYNQDITTAW